MTVADAAPMRDLPGYLRRVGFPGAPHADLSTLRQMVQCHVDAIPFENLDAFVGRAVSLDPALVEKKLVGAARGGWCFEQNLLLGNVLRSLGFEVTDLAARVVWNRPPDVVTARTHRLLRVNCEGQDWLVDVGFGGQMPTGILEFDSELAQSTPLEPFRLRRSGDERVLESQILGEWRPLYRFDLQPQLPVDFEAANYQLAHDPASHFTQGLTVSRADGNGRRVLRGHPLLGVELAVHPREGESQRRELREAQEVLDALSDVFGIRTGDLPELSGRLARLMEARAAVIQAGEGSAARS